MGQRVGRGIALFFHHRGTRRGEWSAARPGRTLPPGKDPVPILQEAGWAPGPVLTGGKSCPHRDSIPDRPAHSQSLYRLSYPAHNKEMYGAKCKIILQLPQNIFMLPSIFCDKCATDNTHTHTHTHTLTHLLL